MPVKLYSEKGLYLELNAKSKEGTIFVRVMEELNPEPLKIVALQIYNIALILEVLNKTRERVQFSTPKNTISFLTSQKTNRTGFVIESAEGGEKIIVPIIDGYLTLFKHYIHFVLDRYFNAIYASDKKEFEKTLAADNNKDTTTDE